MRIAPENAEEILVTAKQFGWKFTYPDGDQSGELHLVVDQPATLVLQSEDVLHSFFVPAFRQKMDIVPGRYTYAYVTPNKPGQYRLSCNEYCGSGHSKMKTTAIVHESAKDRKENTKWIKAEKAPWMNGKRIYQIQCSGCHKIDGTKATGPALNLIWGTEESIADGTTVTVDRDYVQESIWEPNKKIVKGYAAKMNSFKGILGPEDINRVIAYLKFLKAREDFEGTDEEFAKANASEYGATEEEIGGGEAAAPSGEAGAAVEGEAAAPEEKKEETPTPELEPSK